MHCGNKRPSQTEHPTCSKGGYCVWQETSARQGTQGGASLTGGLSPGPGGLDWTIRTSRTVRFGGADDGSTKPNPDLMWDPILPLADPLPALTDGLALDDTTAKVLKHLAAGHPIAFGVHDFEPITDQDVDDGFLTDENLRHCHGLGVDPENVPRLISEIFRLRRRVNKIDDSVAVVRAMLDCPHPLERLVTLRDSGPKPEMRLTVCARCGCRTRAHDAGAWWVRPDIMDLVSEDDE